jgi:hypothetical protein
MTPQPPNEALFSWWTDILRQRLGCTKARNPPSPIEATAREMRGAFVTIKSASLTRADALALLLECVLPDQQQMAHGAFDTGPPPQPPHRRTFTCRTT